MEKPDIIWEAEEALEILWGVISKANRKKDEVIQAIKTLEDVIGSPIHDRDKASKQDAPSLEFILSDLDANRRILRKKLQAHIEARRSDFDTIIDDIYQGRAVIPERLMGLGEIPRLMGEIAAIEGVIGHIGGDEFTQTPIAPPAPSKASPSKPPARRGRPPKSKNKKTPDETKSNPEDSDTQKSKDPSIHDFPKIDEDAHISPPSYGQNLFTKLYNDVGPNLCTVGMMGDNEYVLYVSCDKETPIGEKIRQVISDMPPPENTSLEMRYADTSEDESSI